MGDFGQNDAMAMNGTWLERGGDFEPIRPVFTRMRWIPSDLRAFQSSFSGIGAHVRGVGSPVDFFLMRFFRFQLWS